MTLLKKSRTYVPAISILAIMVLGIAGFSYAMWSKTLTVQGVVKTGKVDAVWCRVMNPDPPGPPPSYDLNADGTRKLKDVGSTTVTGNGTDTLTVTANNTYPCYYNDLEIEWCYLGTVPAKVQNITVTPIGFTPATAIGANDGPIYIHVTNGIGTQVHYGDVQAHSLIFHVEQCAAQNTTYAFTVTIQLVLWTEYIP